MDNSFEEGFLKTASVSKLMRNFKAKNIKNLRSKRDFYRAAEKADEKLLNKNPGNFGVQTRRGMSKAKGDSFNERAKASL